MACSEDAARAHLDAARVAAGWAVHDRNAITLPPPGEIAREIVEGPRAALEPSG
jgi:hypothetical protein